MIKNLIILLVVNCSVLFSQVSTIWEQRYNGTGNGYDEATSLFVDGAGNVYTAGASTGSGSDIDFAVVKYSQGGSLLWSARYNGPGNSADDAYLVKVDNAGNVYVSGASTGSGTDYDYCVIKYNSGNSYVTCAATGTTTDQDFVTIKYDASGNQVWTVTYNGPGNGEDFPSSNAIDGSGNIYVTGYSLGNGTDMDYCTIKYNNSGQQQWVSRYDGPDGYDESFNIILDNSGNVYVTGNSSDIGAGDDYCTIKYDNSGQELWVARYNGGGASNDYCNWVAVDPTGNVYVTGIVGDSAGNPQNCVTIGYNSAGVQQWLVTYNGPGDEFDSGNALAVDNAGNVYVTGGSDNANNTDFITIRYSSTIGIQPVSNEIPQSFSLGQNYPNPFNPVTKIKFSIPKSTYAKLIVYNSTGKQVSTLADQNLSAGVYETEFESTGLSSGIYFYRLITSEFTETRKMILVK